MKHLNRNIYLLFIGIIEAFFIIYTIIMYRRGIVETGELVFGCCCMAIMAAMCIVVAFVNKSGKKKEDGPVLDLTEVPHSREGIIFEVLTLLIIIAAWVVAIATDRFWDDGFFYFLNPVTLFILTIMVITVLWFVYMPNFISMVSRHTNVKQVNLEVRMCRVLAVELALFVLGYALPLENSSTSFFYTRIILYIAGAVLLVTVAVFRYLINKARSNPKGIKQDAAVDSFDIDHVKLPRTILGTSIEVLVVVLIVLAWVLAAINGIFADDDIYASFLNPDQTYNSDRREWMFILTIIIFVTLWQAHRPDKIIEKDKWPKVTNLKQVKLFIGSFRVLALILAIFMILFSFQSFDFLWLLIGLSAVTFIGGIITIILIRRARD